MVIHKPKEHVKQAAPRKAHKPSAGFFNPGRVVLAALLAAVLAAGCHKNGSGGSEEAIVPSDPQVAENLATLSRELRKAMPHYKLSRNFEEFVATTHVEAPPPPSGQKYAISQKWQVILVQAK